ncbi:hypothetical protein [Latilactobacillus fuchuensis]|nr:hypothetical protein [Latilactobacillus fuchuensis]
MRKTKGESFMSLFLQILAAVKLILVIWKQIQDLIDRNKKSR